MFAIFLFSLFMLSITSAKIDSSFTKDYFTNKNIAQIVVFGCWNNSDIFNYYKDIMNTNIRISYHMIEDNLDMKIVLKVNYYKIGVVLDMDCFQSHTIFNQFSAAQLPFNESYVWLSITSSPDIPTTILNKLPLTIESELTLVLVRKPAYVLYDVYNHSYRHGGKLNTTLMGYWDENGLKNHLIQYKYKRRQDFNGITLNFSYILMHKPKMDLETYLTTPIDAHLDSMSRAHYTIVKHLRDMYNFKINLMQYETWGYLKNGTYNGILGDMMKGIVDVSVSPFRFIKSRLSVCEFTVETYVVKLYFIFRHPKKNTVTNAFFKPFSNNVWWLLLNTSILIWILLLILIKVEEHYNNQQKPEFYSNIASETALITVAAVSQQGLNEGPHMYSGRIVFITLFLWTLLTYQFYSASIVGSLLAPSAKFINNLMDLANSDLHITLENVPYTRAYFNITTEPADVYLYNKKMKPPQKHNVYIDAKEGIEKMKKGGFAFFIDSATGYKMIEDTFKQSEICELSEVEIVPPQSVTIITSKHSPFKKIFIYGIRQMVERGLVRHMYNTWHNRKPSCPESFRSLPVPIEMKEFMPAIFLIISGFILASTIMSVEYLIRWKFRSRIDSLS